MALYVSYQEKKLVNPTNLLVDEECQVKWSVQEILTATIVAMGNKADIENAEKKLTEDFEEQESPAKRRRKVKALHHIQLQGSHLHLFSQ